MRVYEVAKEFSVDAEKMIQLLRSLGAEVRTDASAVDDATIAKLRARFERERRAGHVDLGESLDAVMGEVQPTATRRRRRKKADMPPEPAEAESAADVFAEAPSETPVEAAADVAAPADSTADAAADAAEAIAAEAAEEAAAIESAAQPFPEIDEPAAADAERAAEQVT
ncbi:MAG: translation initiation factor IF-2 N-terminal domain-containing protein, partial [Longimicrobiales bacterium]